MASMKLMQTLDQEQGVEMELSLVNELRIPKREVPAEVTFLFATGSARSCLFFLNYFSPQRRGEESLAEYLDSMDAFLPLRDRKNGEFFIVHVNQIISVREAAAVEMHPGRQLRLVLENGAELSLRTCEPRLTWRARPIDLLNEPGRFAVFLDDELVRIHVNKRFIMRVEGI